MPAITSATSETLNYMTQQVYMMEYKQLGVNVQLNRVE